MKTIVMAIGISNYQDDSFAFIQSAQVDAARFASAFISWGIPKEGINLLTNEKATKANMIRAFNERRLDFVADAKLIFYFAGHGIRESGESFLVCHDSKKGEVASSALRLVELMQLIQLLRPAQAFLFIDACNQRLNHLENPFQDIISPINSHGLFCLFSSGIAKAGEELKYKQGSFTNALLKAIAELRSTLSVTCHDIVRKVSASLKNQSLSPPEVYHVGLENMWLLEKIDGGQNSAAVAEEIPALVRRRGPLASLQDHLVSYPDPILWMWGEEGVGKTVIAEQFAKTYTSAIYTTIPIGLTGFDDVQHAVMEQIRFQKREYFFNSTPEDALCEVLGRIFSHQHDSVFILDHLDRLSSVNLEALLSEIDKVSIPCILVSRYFCQKHFFNRRHSQVFCWLTAGLNAEEIGQIVARKGLDASLTAILLNATNGNALKVHHMLASISQRKASVEGKTAKEYIKHVTAVAACGGFLDEQLFCKAFNLKSNILANLEKLGLIRYTEQGCYPHDLLMEMVEEHQWPLDIYKACLYWKIQILSTPYDRWSCCSLVILVSQIENCTMFKYVLGQCLETLNERDYLSFLIDLVRIFRKMRWNEFLLKASDYLIDHEEYTLSGKVLHDLLQSENRAIRNHACKNEARRLVWLGQFKDLIQMDTALKDCRSPELLLPFKNNVGIAHFFSGNLDEAMKLFQENHQWKGKKVEREIGIAKHMLAMILTYRGENTVKIMELFKSSMQIFETTKFDIWKIVNLNGLGGGLCYRTEQWNQALYYLNKAIDIAEALQNKAFILFTLKNIARVHLRLSGIDGQELSLIGERMEILLQEVLERGNDWMTVRAQNTLGILYAQRKEIDKLQIAIDAVAPRTMNYKLLHIFTLSNQGHLAGLRKDYDAAKQHYRQAFQLAEEMKNKLFLQEMKKDFIGCALPHFLQEM